MLFGVGVLCRILYCPFCCLYLDVSFCGISSIGVGLGSMTSQNGGQDGRHDSEMATMAPIQVGRHGLSISLGLTSDDLGTRSVTPRRVS